MTQQPIIFTTTHEVRWGDLDALNHVNNACFFTYMEQARLLWWKQNNLSLNLDALGPVLAHASCDYIRPLTFPNNIQISLSLSDPGRSSFNINYLICAAHDIDLLYATGKTTVVWVNYKKQKPVPLPLEIQCLFSTTE